MEFAIGKKIQHAYTKEYLWVLKIGKEQILCRTKDLREVWFYQHELEEISIKENQGKEKLNSFRPPNSQRFL